MTRNWKEYNDKLVKRGEFYISVDFIQHWDQELQEMNMDKRGSPFQFPQSFVEYTALLKIAFNLPYRQLEGVLSALSQYIPGLQAADYTTLWRRIRGRICEIEPLQPMIGSQDEDEGVVVAIDATGMKVTRRGDWIRKKWKVRKGWIKVHIAVHVNTKELLALEVTDEKVGDSKEFENLIEQAERTLNGRKIKRILADAAHDKRDSFNYIKKRGIESGIKTRKNASTRARGSPYRAQCVREVKKIGYDAWKAKYGYGMRWASEGYFSAVKRLCGEDMRATSKEGMIQEVKMKFLFYTMIAHAV
jgi:hypothetical protein